MFFKKKPIMLFRKRKNNDDIKKENDDDLIPGMGVEITTKEEALSWIDEGVSGSILGYCSDELRRDREVVLAAVAWQGFDFEYASKKFHGDTDVIYNAYLRSEFPESQVLAFIDKEEFKNDADFWINLIQIQYSKYPDWRYCHIDPNKYFGEELKHNKCFAEEAVLYFWQYYDFFDEEVKQSEKVQIAAIKAGATFADLRLQLQQVDNEEIALTRLGIFTPLDSFDVYLDYTDSSYEIDLQGRVAPFTQADFDRLSNRLKYSKEFAMKVIKENVSYYQFLSGELKQDKELAMKVIKEDDRYYQFLSDELKQDKEILGIMIEKNPNRAGSIISNAKLDKAAVLKYARDNLNVLENYDEYLDDKDFMLKLIALNPAAIKWLKLPMRCNKDFMQKVIELNPAAKNLLPTKLKSELGYE